MKKLRWQKEPPRKIGWWFASTFRRSNSKRKRFVQVAEVRIHYGKWEVFFAQSLDWESLGDVPSYEWSGPLLPPL